MALNDELIQRALQRSNPSLKRNKTSSYSHFKIYEIPHINMINDNDERRMTKIESEEKPRTNLGQTKDKPKTKIKTNLGQTKDKARTIHGTPEDKLKTQPRTKPRTNQGQTKDKLGLKLNFSSLVGLQRKIVIFIYEACKVSQGEISGPITIEHLSISCETSKLSAQKTIQRLEKFGAVIRKEFKNGRGGWTKYGLSKSLFQEVLHYEMQEKLRTNIGQTLDNVKTQPRTEPRTSVSSSSSLNNINTTTTENNDSINSIPAEWEELDYSGFKKHNIPFGRGHITALWRFLKAHSVFDIQESMDAYVYDIENNHLKLNKGKANLFIHSIREGQPYLSSYYVSSERKKMNEIVELAKKREHEKLLYLEALEEEKFHKWLSEYGEENIKRHITDASILIDFEHKGEHAFDWIKKNLYKKI